MKRATPSKRLAVDPVVLLSMVLFAGCGEAGKGGSSACAPSYGPGWAVATGNDPPGVSSVAVSASGDVAYAGALIQNRDTNGAILWSLPLSAYAIAPIADGGFYVTVSVPGDAGKGVPSVTRLDRNGATVWSQPLPSPAMGLVTNLATTFLATDPNEGVWVLGTQETTPSGGPEDNGPPLVGPFLARFDPAGNVMWQESLGDVAMIYTTGLVVGADGQAFVSLNINGGQLSIGNSDGGTFLTPTPVVVSINPEGTTSWIDAIPQGGVYSLALANDGTVYAAGASLSSGSFVVALDKSGEVIWQNTYAAGSEKPLVAARPCGGLVLGAFDGEPGSNDTEDAYTLIELSASGDEQGRLSLDCASQCVSSGLVAQGADGIVLTGQFWGAAFASGPLTLTTTLSDDSFIARIPQ